MNYIPDDYEPVEDRIRAFYADHPAGRIITDLIKLDGESVTFRAEVFRELDPEPMPASTGHAHGLLVKPKAVEFIETVSIGRALANLGYAKQGARASAEEMQAFQETQAPTGPPPKPKVVRSAPTAPPEDDWATPVDPETGEAATMAAAVQTVVEQIPGSEVISEGATHDRKFAAQSTTPTGKSTPKQLGFLKRLLKDNDPSVVDDDTALIAVNDILAQEYQLGPVESLEDLNKHNASKIIDTLKAVAG